MVWCGEITTLWLDHYTSHRLIETEQEINNLIKEKNKNIVSHFIGLYTTSSHFRECKGKGCGGGKEGMIVPLSFSL